MPKRGSTAVGDLPPDEAALGCLEKGPPPLRVIPIAVRLYVTAAALQMKPQIYEKIFGLRLLGARPTVVLLRPYWKTPTARVEGRYSTWLCLSGLPLIRCEAHLPYHAFA